MDKNLFYCIKSLTHFWKERLSICYLRVLYFVHETPRDEWVKVALRPSNAKRLYMDEESTEIGEIKE